MQPGGWLVWSHPLTLFPLGPVYDAEPGERSRERGAALHPAGAAEEQRAPAGQGHADQGPHREPPESVGQRSVRHRGPDSKDHRLLRL